MFVPAIIGDSGYNFGTGFALYLFRKWFAQECESNRGRNRDEAVPGLPAFASSPGRIFLYYSKQVG